MRGTPLALVLLAGLAAGCAGQPTMSSFVDSRVPKTDMPVIADAVVAFVSMRQPPGPVAVMAPPRGDDGLAVRIAEGLRAAGIAVAPSGPNRLAYRIAPYDAGALLLRVDLGGEHATRLFIRGRGDDLVPSGPFAVTVTEASR